MESLSGTAAGSGTIADQERGVFLFFRECGIGLEATAAARLVHSACSYDDEFFALD